MLNALVVPAKVGKILDHSKKHLTASLSTDIQWIAELFFE
jgi:hypothetical protein